MSMTMTQKILAHHAGLQKVEAGELKITGGTITGTLTVLNADGTAADRYFLSDAGKGLSGGAVSGITEK